jgi:hypothetical protein
MVAGPPGASGPTNIITHNFSSFFLRRKSFIVTIVTIVTPVVMKDGSIPGIPNGIRRVVRVLAVPPDHNDSPLPSSLLEFNVNSDFRHRRLQPRERVRKVLRGLRKVAIIKVIMALNPVVKLANPPVERSALEHLFRLPLPSDFR